MRIPALPAPCGCRPSVFGERARYVARSPRRGSFIPLRTRRVACSTVRPVRWCAAGALSLCCPSLAYAQATWQVWADATSSPRALVSRLFSELTVLGSEPTAFREQSQSRGVRSPESPFSGMHPGGLVRGWIAVGVLLSVARVRGGVAFARSHAAREAYRERSRATADVRWLVPTNALDVTLRDDHIQGDR
jgi:hypothetical protein